MAVSHRARSTRLLVIGLVVASLVTITIDFRGGDSGPLSLAGRVAVGIVAPLQEAVSKVFRPIGSFFSGLTNVGSLRAENARLRQEVRELSDQTGSAAELQRENDALKQLLNLTQKGDFNTIGATVIGEAPSNFEQSISLNRGTGNGVTIGMPVIAPDGLVGRVVKVGDRWSSVLLIIDQGSTVAARLSASGERGGISGAGPRPLDMEFVDNETKVQPGEIVVTSSYDGGVFPDGIKIGRVERILPAGADLYRHVEVRPYVDFSKLTDVLIVTSQDSDLPQQVREPS